MGSWLVPGGKDEKKKNKEDTPLKISGIKKKVIDWSEVFAGKGTKRANDVRKGGDSPLVLTDKAVQSPARKKAFKPKSLLTKFNEAKGSVDTSNSAEVVPRRNVSSLMEDTDTDIATEI